MVIIIRVYIYIHSSQAIKASYRSNWIRCKCSDTELMVKYTRHTKGLFEATDMLTVISHSPHGGQVSHYNIQTLYAVKGHSWLVTTQHSLQLFQLDLSYVFDTNLSVCVCVWEGLGCVCGGGRARVCVGCGMCGDRGLGCVGWGQEVVQSCRPMRVSVARVLVRQLKFWGLLVRVSIAWI